ncbi:MAG TPA: DUF892 family protein [Candidatus Baltobacteraceae bacterium]|nr:DUF892 family protein [Candidatus Baltobacteraceae bacterium]
MSDIGQSPGYGEDLATSASIRYDSTADDEAAAGGDERHAIQTYVSDMLALERHIAQPLHRQLGMPDAARYPEAHAAIAQIANLADAHVTALEQLLATLGGHEADPVKSAWSELLGLGAAAIDAMRKTKISKSLRDDYTALNLAAVSYTMLHATAVGIGEPAVSDLARTHLADYARAIMGINQVIADVVLQELRDDGELVAVDAAERIRQQTNAIWRAESDVTQP